MACEWIRFMLAQPSPSAVSRSPMAGSPMDEGRSRPVNATARPGDRAGGGGRWDMQIALKDS